MAALGLQIHPILTGLLVVLFVVISVMMMLVVLIQRPSGGGLSGAFGASSEGAGQTAFGAKTGDALTTATIVIFLLFLVCAVGLNYTLQPPTEVVPAEVDSPPDPNAPPAGQPSGTTGTTPAPAGDTSAPTTPPPADTTTPPQGADTDPNQGTGTPE